MTFHVVLTYLLMLALLTLSHHAHARRASGSSGTTGTPSTLTGTPPELAEHAITPSPSITPRLASHHLPWNANIDLHQLLTTKTLTSHAVVDTLLQYLQWFATDQSFTQHQINTFSQQLLLLLRSKELVLDVHTVESLLKQHHMIHYLLQLQTAPKVKSKPVLDVNTVIKLVRSQRKQYGAEQYLPRLLLLVSTTTTVQLTKDEHQQIYRWNANLWNFAYTAFLRSFQATLASPRGQANLQRYVNLKDIIYNQYHIFDEHLSSIYYGVTYISAEHDANLKQHINNVLQYTVFDKDPTHRKLRARNSKQVALTDSSGKPRKLRLALISQFWFTTHSVYRITASYLQGLHLSNQFDLTLLNIGEMQPQTATEYFDTVHEYKHDSDLQKANDIVQHCLQHQYDIVLYPSVGMGFTDIYLSNTRLAPIQIVLNGHPVSTFGSHIDYWVSGDKVEMVDKSDDQQLQPSQRFSETLVLLPQGYGAVHNKPAYELNARNANITDSNKLTVSIPSTGQKINNRYLQTLRRIMLKVEEQLQDDQRVVNITLQLLPHIENRVHRKVLQKCIHQSLYANTTYKLLKVDIVVRGALSYKEYMQHLQLSDFALESFHYGGGNSILDALWTRCPIVTWRGQHWYNRIGSAIVEQMNQEALSQALTSNDEQQYIDNIVRMVTDAKHRTAIRQQLANTDLSPLLAAMESSYPTDQQTNVSESVWFARALQALYTQHQVLQKAEQQPKAVVNVEQLWSQHLANGGLTAPIGGKAVAKQAVSGKRQRRGAKSKAKEEL